VKTFTKFFSRALVLLLLSALTAEVTLRLLGFSPDHIVKKNIRVEPGGSFFLKDSITGFNTRTGSYRVTLESDSSFYCTHDTLLARQSSTQPEQHRPEIWVFGCSYTYGWSLDDSLTFCWKLQEALPQYTIRNFGKPGFSTLQCLLFFRHLLLSDTPVVAVLAHASFHDERNVASRSWLRTLAEHNRLGPLAHPAMKKEHGTWTVHHTTVQTHTSWWRRHSSLIAWIGRQSEQPSRATRSEVMRYLFAEFQATCANHHVQPLIAGITKDHETEAALAYAESIDIPTTNMSVDLQEPGNLNLPADNHPSAAAHRQYARRLLKGLKDRLHISRL
jgi:hypothetical protein